jgi:hypothetical protein
MVIHKRLSFFSVLALSLATITVVLIISAAGITVYGLRLLDKKTDGLIGLFKETAKAVPELCQSLPPALADAIEDERRPDYINSLSINVHLLKEGDDRRFGHRCRAAVEVENRGDETVTLLAMRIVALDEDGDPVMEHPAWAATPLQVEGEWRGPLLPHGTRRFSVWCHGSEPVAKLTYEVTELRVWRKASSKARPERALPSTESTGSQIPAQ